MEFASPGEINICFSQPFRMTDWRDAGQQHICQSDTGHLRKLTGKNRWEIWRHCSLNGFCLRGSINSLFNWCCPEALQKCLYLLIKKKKKSHKLFTQLLRWSRGTSSFLWSASAASCGDMGVRSCELCPYGQDNLLQEQPPNLPWAARITTTRNRERERNFVWQ